MSAFVFEQLETHGEIVTVGATPAERAAQIVADAQVRAVEIEAEARAAGEAAGYAAGLARAQEELAVPRATVAAAVDAITTARDAMCATIEPRAVELALAVAERIVGAAISVQPELVLTVVEGALRRVVERDRLALDVNPDDVSLVREWLSTQPDAAIAAIEVRPERRVGRGGCVVRTAEGEIDARIAEQLVRAEDVLRDAIAGTAA